MLFRLDFLVLCIDQALRVHKLHFNGLEMLFEDLEALLMLFDFQVELGDEAHLLPDDLIELLVLIVGIGREVLVQIVLCDRVNNVVGHFNYL